MRSSFLAISFLVATALNAIEATAATQAGAFEQLHNGKDLSGWDVYLTPPLEGKKVDASGPGLGLNPEGQSTIQVQPDGSIRIKGRLWGGINTQASHANYHLRLETRWGDAKFAPREERPRDSGIIFHCQPPHGAFWGIWMAGCEYQVQEHDFGDYFAIASPIVETTLQPDAKDSLLYWPDGIVSPEHRSRIQRSVEREMPHGEWNTCEIIARADEAVHITNGLVNNRYRRIRTRTTTPPSRLDSGHIQLQSEGAEVYYRAIELRDIGARAMAAKPCAFDVSAKKLALSSTYQSVTFTNTADHPADVVAFELVGVDAKYVELQLPELPVQLEPGKPVAVQVKLKQGAAMTAPVTLRVETLCGPAAAVVALGS